MKKKVTKRTVKYGDKEKPVDGLFGFVEYIPESTEDRASLYGNKLKSLPEKNLEAIIEAANETLKELPEQGRWYIAHNDRTWRYLPDNYEELPEDEKRKIAPRTDKPSQITNSLHKNSLLIERCSAHYYAADARAWAEVALFNIKQGNHQSAIHAAMNAVGSEGRRLAIEAFEPPLMAERYRILCREDAPKTGGRKRVKWADEIVAYLRYRYPNQTLEFCWQRLNVILPNYYGEFRVEMEGDTLISTSMATGKEGKYVTKSNFEKTYFYK